MSSRQVASLIALLKKLRQREGLTVDRLQRNSREADELLRVPALAAHRKPGESADLGAVVDTMVEMATELEPVDRAVIDTALGLGLSNSPALDSDTRPDLTQRRRILLEEWSSRVGGDAPSDTSLRTRLEDDAIEAFAQRLVDTGGSNALDEHRAVGRAVVIGGATIDHQYRVDAFPEFGQERSLAAQSLEERPGGKGLTLAVALARLGFEVDLVSAIGQDAAGDQVLDFLAAEGVGSAFVDRQAERTGRVTILTHKDTGDSFAIAWMNREELMVKRSLALEAIESLTTSDNVLFTLEPRFENIRSVLDALPAGTSEQASGADDPGTDPCRRPDRPGQHIRTDRLRDRPSVTNWPTSCRNTRVPSSEPGICVGFQQSTRWWCATSAEPEPMATSTPRWTARPPP